MNEQNIQLGRDAKVVAPKLCFSLESSGRACKALSTYVMPHTRI